MTKVFGFVAEFNPFHNGHKLFIDRIKNTYHPDVLIAVMSGNFVQRGDFAVLNKWQRAQIACDNGVDLVIELPFYGAVQPANIFAETAVKILADLGVTDIVFGTEEEINFQNYAEKLNRQVGFQQDYHLSYAQNFNNALNDLGIDTSDKPNQLLGLNYSLAILQNDYPIQIHPLIRESNGYSATKIRKNLSLKNGLSIADQLPNESYMMLSKQPILTWNDFYPYLRYKILTNSTNELQLTYQMVEGLNYKVKKEINNASSFEDFLFRIKSKRYTLARIRRLLMYVLMNVNTEDMQLATKELYLHILSFSNVGQKYLNSYKKQLQIPLITKVGKPQSALMTLEIRADNVRKLIDGKEQNFGVIPYIKGEN